jgi:hypothetical protein
MYTYYYWVSDFVCLLVFQIEHNILETESVSFFKQKVGKHLLSWAH